MSLDTLARMTGIPIVGETKKKMTTEDRLVEVIQERKLKMKKDPLNYWDKLQIMFSVDVNALASNDEQADRLTKFNRDNYMNIIQECVSKVNKEWEEDGIGAYSISEMNGCYVSKSGETFIEKSYSIEILGLPDLIGKDLALNLKSAFMQETVMFIVGKHTRLI